MPTTDEEKLIISLEARLSKYEREMKRATVISSQTARKIENDFSKLDRAIGRMGGGLKAFAGGFLGGAFSQITNPQAIIQGIGQVIKAADDLVDSADRLGISATDLKAFQATIQALGGEAADATPGLEFFFRLLGKAAQGNSAAIKTMKDYGLSLRQLQTVDAAGKIELLMRAISRLGDEEQRIAATQALMGRGAASLALPMGKAAEAVGRFRTEAEALKAMNFEKTERQLADYAAEWEQVTRTMEVELHKQVVLAAQGAERVENSLDSTAKAVGGFFKNIFGAAPAFREFEDLAALQDTLRAQLLLLIQDILKGQKLAAAGLIPSSAVEDNIQKAKELATQIQKIGDEIQKLAPDIWDQWKNSITAMLGPLSRIADLLAGIGTTLGQNFVVGPAAPGMVLTDENAEKFLQARAVSDRIAERVKKLDDEFAAAVATLLEAFPKLKINSAFRTFAEQTELYRQSQAGLIGPAARPGTSLHEKGLAVDINFNDLSAEEQERIRKMAEELGLEFPVSLRVNDPGHLQSAEPGMRAAFEAADKAAEDAADREKKAAEDAAAALKRKREDLEQIFTDREQELAFAQLELDYTGKSAQALEEERIYLEEINRLKAANLTIDEEAVARARQHAVDLAAIHASQVSLEEAQAATIERLDAMRDLSSDVFGGIISDLRAGASAGEIFANVLDKIIAKLGDMAVNMLTTALFGASGTAQTGLLGGLLGGLIPGRQHGGAVEAGSPYVVGETQPELFVPNVSGRIMPSVPRGLGAASASIINGQLRGVIDINPSPLFMTSVAQTSASMIAANNRRLPSYLADRQRRGI